MKDTLNRKTDKIWCPEKEGFQYINACASNCKKNYLCKAYEDYLQPRLF